MNVIGQSVYEVVKLSDVFREANYVVVVFYSCNPFRYCINAFYRSLQQDSPQLLWIGMCGMDFSISGWFGSVLYELGWFGSEFGSFRNH
jgi:hypothetical protein